jgi:hypothetical protein
MRKRRYSHKIAVNSHLSKIALGISIRRWKNIIRNDLKAKVGIDLRACSDRL